MDSTVLIATPAYDGCVDVDYLLAFMEYKSAGIIFGHMFESHDSLLPHARNTLISMAYHHREVIDFLLFLDADVYLPADGLLKLISRKTDVIAAPVPIRGFKGQPGDDNAICPNIGTKHTQYDDDPTLVEVERVGTAALLISMKAVVSLIDDAIGKGRVYYGHYGGWDRQRSFNQPVSDRVPMFDVFTTGAVNGEYLSEDYGLCDKLRSLGYKILVDPTIRTRHSSRYVWKTPLDADWIRGSSGQ